MEPTDKNESGGKPLNKKLLLAGGLAVVAIAIVAAVLLLGGISVSITATSVVETKGITTVVSPDTRFVIQVEKGSLTLEELEKLLSVEPDFPYLLEALEEGGFELRPRGLLKGGDELRITVGSQVFRYEVENRLMLVSHFPADDGEKVPTSSGIELRFNQEVDLNRLNSAVSISPAVEGYFDYGDGRYVYYPITNMEYETRYTVIISGNLRGESRTRMGEDISFSFTTISEREEKLENSFYLSGGTAVNTLTSETTVLRAYLNRDLVEPDMEVEVTLYDLGGWQTYGDLLLALGENSWDDVVKPESYSEYASFAISPLATSGEGYENGSWILPFPDTMPEGCYLAGLTLTIDDTSVTRWRFLQVSDISVFFLNMDKYLLVWANDAADGSPLEGARVEMQGGYEAAGATDRDGILYIEDGRKTSLEEYESNTTVFTVTQGDRVFVGTDYYADYTTLYQDSVEANKYYSYLLTDRSIYRTTDTIQVWGMVRPRYDDIEAPKTVTLRLGSALEEEVSLGGDGTFTTKLSFESLTSDYSYLSMELGEARLFYQSLTIEDFEKPVYTGSTAPEQPVYLLTDSNQIAATVDISMFDGTPASSLELKFGGGYRIKSQSEESLYTDEVGHLRVTMEVEESPNTWYPQSYSYYFYSAGAEVESFRQNGSGYVIHRDLMLKGKPVFDGDDAEIHISAHRVDISGIESSDDLWRENTLQGEALDVDVEVEIHRTYYQREKTGTTYDYISRTSVDSYRYNRVDEIAESLTVTTQNGVHIVNELPRSNREESYYVILRSRDSGGRLVETRVYLGGAYDYYSGYDNGTHRFDLVKRSGPDDESMREEDGNIYFNRRLYSFTDGETVTYELRHNDQPLQNAPGRVLYTVVQDSFSAMGVGEGGSVSLPFEEFLVPGYMLTGAYFDGQHIFALDNTHMSFDASSRALDIMLAPDKESYGPGDDVQVTATVRGESSGQPAANSVVVLSVVDEAVFAVQEQYVNILERIYSNRFYHYLNKYASYDAAAYEGPGGAEMGGGGGDSVRVDFEDTAFFQTATTDGEGKASFRFTLPDNITSWRLTTLSVSPGNHAGNDKINISATQDFFVLPIVNQELIQGDSFAVGLYSAGVGVADSDPVSYWVQLTGNGVDKTLEQTSTVRGYASVDFGEISRGDYTVTVRGESGGYSDAVQLPVSVNASGVEISLVKTFALRDGIQVEPLRYPVTINFYSKSAQTFNEIMRSLQQGSRGGRTDMRIVRKYIAQYNQKQGADWVDTAALQDSLSDVGLSWVLRLFPYSDNDMELAVRAYLAAPELVGTGFMGSAYIGAGFESDAIIYLAQALDSGDPDEDMAELLEKDYNLDYVEKIYLTMALHLSGDEEGAREWYGKLVTANLKELTGVSGKAAYYIDAGDRARSVHDCTAAASMLATMLGTVDAEPLVRYLDEVQSEYEPYLLERLYYLAQNPTPQGDTGKLRYTRSGQVVEESISGSKSISFTREQLAEADFSLLSGDIYADVYYVGSPSEESDTAHRKIALTKRVEAVDGVFKPGALVKITLTPDFSGLDTGIGSKQLVIDDYIPTGMRFERYQPRESSVRQGWYLNSRQGQRLQFTMYDPDLNNTIVYYVRCSTPGDYVVESAYISSLVSEIWGASDRSVVRIQPQ